VSATVFFERFDFLLLAFHLSSPGRWSTIGVRHSAAKLYAAYVGSALPWALFPGLYHVSCEPLRIFWNDDTTCSTRVPRVFSTTCCKARKPARSRQHAWHSCRAATENPQGLATRMIRSVKPLVPWSKLHEAKQPSVKSAQVRWLLEMPRSARLAEAQESTLKFFAEERGTSTGSNRSTGRPLPCDGVLAYVNTGEAWTHGNQPSTF